MQSAAYLLQEPAACSMSIQTVLPIARPTVMIQALRALLNDPC